jgi:penicillin-insensitive murein endopeptidase
MRGQIARKLCRRQKQSVAALVQMLQRNEERDFAAKVRRSARAGGTILMNTAADQSQAELAGRRRWMRIGIICGAAVLCLGLGLGVADAKKQKQANKATVSTTAKAGKARAAYSRRKISRGKAKAVAVAKARAGARRRKGRGDPLTTGAMDGPPSPPARDLFGAQKAPSPLAARAIGSYARGCLAGGRALPVNGSAWQAMRLSRNRNWGHPKLVAFVEKLATESQQIDRWPGLLVGDLAQPMGGPMVSGHASHQIGLDADIWLKPMPNRILTGEERENISADTVVADDRVSLKPDVWQDGHVRLLKRAASYPEVARIFVHPAIKKGLCEAAGPDREWLSKVRPWWGHNYHFHVRLACPPGSEGCEDQAATGPEDGCGKELQTWLTKVSRPVVPAPTPAVPARPRPPMTMAQLPPECSMLVGYEPPPPVPMGPPLPERRPGAQTAGQPGNAARVVR